MATSTTRNPGRAESSTSDPAGITACRYPSRFASMRRRCTLGTRLISPANPTSPNTTVFAGSGFFVIALTMAMAMARSVGGAPPPPPPPPAPPPPPLPHSSQEGNPAAS